ncbi:MAG: hypothetical protein AB1486_20575 [Planctomycetota bacterium]
MTGNAPGAPGASGRTSFSSACRAAAFFLLLLTVASCATEERESRPPPSGRVFGTVRITRKDVYDLEEHPGFFYKLINALNVTVREHVIRHEVEAVLLPGDSFDPELLAEVERNLRALPFVAHASALPVYRDDRRVDVDVETQDRFTLAFGAAAGIFGGSGKFRASLAEEDFFGYGKRVKVTYKTDPDKDTLETKFTDPHFLGTHHVLDLKLSETTDGHDHYLNIEQPFKTLASSWSYGMSLGTSERLARFFEEGDEVASVPIKREEAGLFFLYSSGPRENLLRPGMRLSFRRDVYDEDEAEGEGVDQVRIPEDTRVLTAGPMLRWDRIPRYEERHRLDAFDSVEDVPIGLTIDAFVGLQHRRPEQSEASSSLAVSTSGRFATDWNADHLTTLGGSLEFREDGDPLGWRASSFWHHYFTGFSYQTWVMSMTLDGQWEREDLNTEITLGEDSGLRGYPIRQFSGHKRLRFNLEDRLFTDLEVLSVALGGVVFFDAGMVWDRGEAMRLSDLARSVGFGFRFGSPALLGKQVVRVDIGFPLDDVEGESFGVSISATIGQVVSLFSNEEFLENNVGFSF